MDCTANVRKMKKELFDLFRENEHKLEERPSSDAWRRLEARLDDRKRRRQSNTFRQMLSVAAVLLLLITVGLAISIQQQDNTSQLTASVQVLEDLSTYEESSEQPLKVMEFTRKHISRLANPIEEGSVEKKLLPKAQ